MSRVCTVKHLEDMLFLLSPPAAVRCPAPGSFEVALQQLSGCHMLGVVDGGSSEAKWADGA